MNHLLFLGLFTLLSVRTEAMTFYVNASNLAPVAPFTNWPTAATDIQSAIDAATDGDLILVTNGFYNTGGRVVYGSLTNRLVINKAVTVQSINGPTVTLIQGFQDPLNPNSYINPQLYYTNNVRCVYMTNNAVLNGFTITNGATRAFNITTNTTVGGGVYCESTNAIITNCFLVNNLNPNFYAGGGAGVYQGTLVSCVLSNNQIPYYGPLGGAACQSVLINCLIISNAACFGGGAALSTLNQCLVVGNFTPVGSVPYGGGLFSCKAANCVIANNRSLGVGGGVCGGTFNNCVIVNNTATSQGGNFFGGGISGTLALNYCCTFPTVPAADGIANFTNAPLFVNLTNDFHLQSNSPCINAGNNAYVSSTNDLDGNPRIVGGTVDIGAYEFQTPASVLSYAWAMQYGLPVDGSADYVDSDGTGMNNWEKWIAGLNPTNPASVLQMTSAYPVNNLNWVNVAWQSVNTRNYYLQRSTNLTASPAFTTIQSNIVGEAGTTTTIDATATNGGAYFYRVGIQ